MSLMARTRLGERVRFVREHRGVSQTDLAREIGTDPQAISYLEREGRKSGFVVQIAGALRANIRWLDSDESALDLTAALVDAGQPTPSSQAIEAQPVDVSAVFGGEELIPVYAGARMGEQGEVFITDGPIDYVPCPPSLHGAEKAYGMVVTGDSMRPMYKPLQTIYAHPKRRPRPGSGVIVWLRNNGVLVKEYVRRSESHLVLREYQPQEREFSLHLQNISRYDTIVSVEDPP